MSTLEITNYYDMLPIELKEHIDILKHKSIMKDVCEEIKEEYLLRNKSNLFDFTKCAHFVFNLMFEDDEEYQRDLYGDDPYEKGWHNNLIRNYCFLESKYIEEYCTCGKSYRDMERDYHTWRNTENYECPECEKEIFIHHTLFHHFKDCLYRLATIPDHFCPSLLFTDEEWDEIYMFYDPDYNTMFV